MVPTYTGYVDAVRHRMVFGWTCDTTNDDRLPVLQININGSDAGITVANRPRPDLISLGITTRPRGFEWVIPDHIRDIESVKVIIVDTGVELPHVSPSLLCTETNRPLPDKWMRHGKYRFPSFFILGAAKCGTTSLHNYLGQHPDICVSHPKEPFYFEAELDRGATYYFNRYFSHWSNETIVGEARHRNLYMPYIAQRIFEYNDSARLIICLRNPAERAVSHWWHWYSRGLERFPLGRSIELDWERIRTGLFYDSNAARRIYRETLESDGKGYLRTYIDSGYYYRHIQRYLSLFDIEQLHIILFDDLKHDPEAVTRQLLTFIGADTGYASRINYSFLNTSTPEMRTNIEAETFNWLIEHYRLGNQELASLIGRNLDHWNLPFELT